MSFKPTVPYSELSALRRTESEALLGGVSALAKELGKTLDGEVVVRENIKAVWAFTSDAYGPKRLIHGLGVTYEAVGLKRRRGGSAELILLRTRKTADRLAANFNGMIRRNFEQGKK